MKISTAELYGYITGDFETLWDSLVKTSGPNGGGGNFLFASHSILFLEWVCRLIDTDILLHRAFSQALQERDKKYLTQISKRKITVSGEFKLPSIPHEKSGTTLLDAIYSQIRNGHSHYYFQNLMQLAEGKFLSFFVEMNGMTIQQNDLLVRSNHHHLNLGRNTDGNLGFYFNPALFYLDIKHAMEAVGLQKFPQDLQIPINKSLKEIRLEDVESAFVVPSQQNDFPFIQGETGMMFGPQPEA